MKKNSSIAVVRPEERSESTPELKAWALVELFGHQRIVGKVTVDPVDFPGMVRVDVPDLLKNGVVERPGFTRYFGRSALYAVTPISEDSVRELLPHVNGYPSRPLSIGSNRLVNLSVKLLCKCGRRWALRKGKPCRAFCTCGLSLKKAKMV